MKQNMKEAIGLSLKRYNDTYMKAANDRIDNIVSQAGTDNTEIVDARIDSAGVTHTTLNNRILAETKMNDEQLVEYTGSNISAEDTTQGYLKDVEILGNTIQNEEDLADIKSVGVLQEDGTYKMSILSCGKNLFDEDNIIYGGLINTNNGINVNASWFYTDYIKVKKGNYHLGVYRKPFDNYYCHFYDINKTHIGYGDSVGFAFNGLCTFNQDGYIRLSGMVSSINEAQLEEGTQATSYEPYQGNKCDILLPCQLEKVGDVSDRLYYDDVEKAWCIEKNFETRTLTENESWIVKWVEQNNTIGFGFKMPGVRVESIHTTINYALCDRFILPKVQNSSYYEYDVESFTVWDSSDQIGYIKINKNKLNSVTVDGFREWLKNNPTTIKYQLTTPQKIVLPLDVQIQFNSFFGTTHIYMESGEVEGTIKCKIPKSLGATVQSLNNKTDILSDRIEAIEGLKDSQNMKYETDKGYLACKETKNGVIDDLKIEGKTLVNIMPFKTYYWNGGTSYWSHTQYVAYDRLIPGEEYTIICFGSVPDFKDVILGHANQANYNQVRVTKLNTPFKFTAINKPEDGRLTIIVNKNNSNGFGSNDLADFKVVLLEGDHTQNPPSYFEGLMSVGQDVDKIEVLSRNKNLFDLDNYLKINNVPYTINEGVYYIPDLKTELFINGHSSYNDCVTFSCKAKLGTATNFRLTVFYTDGSTLDSNYCTSTTDFVLCSVTSNSSKKVQKVSFNWSKGGSVYIKDVMLNKSVLPYEPLKQDKKQILFYNENGELEPIQELHEWDSIEKHSDNKWYYHKRSGKVVLNGSENWTGFSSIEGVGKAYTFSVANKKIGFDNLVCDKLPTIKSYASESHILNGISGTPNNSAIWVSINNSITDIERFKQWLQTNNVTVVYQLTQEEVYEIAPLHLDSYANETLILCNSGAISPKMEFSITSHINELVKAYGERINLLEEKVYKYMIAQNRLQLASTYSADSVTFKVDYFSLCGDEENYDEDLYNLILNNILVGKDNYDYDKMFTMILDYASWNQISWEQFDILVGLMDIQHNPPVEELPTEDEIEEDIIEEDIIENEETPVE